jgi:hypothetical protein
MRKIILQNMPKIFLDKNTHRKKGPFQVTTTSLVQFSPWPTRIE